MRRISRRFAAVAMTFAMALPVCCAQTGGSLSTLVSICSPSSKTFSLGQSGCGTSRQQYQVVQIKSTGLCTSHRRTHRGNARGAQLGFRFSFTLFMTNRSIVIRLPVVRRRS